MSDIPSPSQMAAVRDMYRRHPGKTQRLLRVAADMNNLEPATLLKGMKARNSPRARKMAKIRWGVMLVARDNNISLPAIGYALKRDHSTVHYGLAKARDLLKTDREFASYVSTLELYA